MLKVWTRYEFDREEEQMAKLISNKRLPLPAAREIVRELRTGLEVDFLWNRDTIGEC